jgi:hypothetical protein
MVARKLSPAVASDLGAVREHQVDMYTTTRFTAKAKRKNKMSKKGIPRFGFCLRGQSLVTP